jgi:hypothetical protein
MKTMVACILVMVSLTAGFSRAEDQGDIASKPAIIKGLQIVHFSDGSNLEKAGARVGDTLIKYNGSPIGNLQELLTLRDSAATDLVTVELARDGQTFELNVPKGQLGAALEEMVQEHLPDADARVIDGIGKLEWGVNTECTFLGCLRRIEYQFGQALPYIDLAGLSGFAFRLHFWDGWCPSSPDATSGKDVGTLLLRKLGYTFNLYITKTESMKDKPGLQMKDKDELRKVIMTSIDAGWPVLAADLIEVPEWGIITGYQKEGTEFFCRTYFDKTKGYEIAKKIPMAVIVFSARKDFDPVPLYKQSLILASELYKTEKFDNYYSGLKAIEVWMKALQDEKTFESADNQRYGEISHANWWIYYSLMMARDNAKDYLLSHRNMFDVDPALIAKLAEIYNKEAQLLKSGLDKMPSLGQLKSRDAWTKEMRESEINTLLKLSDLENEALSVFMEMKI